MSKNAQPPMNIDITNAKDISCANCGNYTFEEVVLMKKISALLSPTGKDAIVPIPTFACNACGYVNKEFLPFVTEEPKNEAEETTSKLILEK